MKYLQLFENFKDDGNRKWVEAFSKSFPYQYSISDEAFKEILDTLGIKKEDTYFPEWKDLYFAHGDSFHWFASLMIDHKKISDAHKEDYADVVKKIVEKDQRKQTEMRNLRTTQPKNVEEDKPKTWWERMKSKFS